MMLLLLFWSMSSLAAALSPAASRKRGVSVSKSASATMARFSSGAACPLKPADAARKASAFGFHDAPPKPGKPPDEKLSSPILAFSPYAFPYVTNAAVSPERRAGL